MNKVLYSIPLVLFLGNPLLSQSDTLSTVQNYKEIVIQGKNTQKEEVKKVQLQESTDKLLSLMPEVTMIKRGNYALEPTIRGLSDGQITQTIDGMQMFGACTDKMDVISSYIEPSNLEKIELSTTPSDQQTGSSVGGSINYSLSKAKLDFPRKFSGEVGVGYETNANYFQSLGKFQYSTKRFAIQANGVYRKADNYHAARRQEIKYSQFEKWNLAVNMVGAINESNQISVDYIQDEGYNIGYPALTMDVAYAKAYISAVSHSFAKSSGILRSIDSKIFFNFVNHAMDDTKRPAEEVPMHMDMPGTSRTFGFFSKARLVVQKHIINLQVNGFQNDYHAEMTMYPEIGSEMFMLTLPDGRRRTLGIQASDKWIINSKVRLTYGGRLEANLSDISSEIGRNTLTSFYNSNPTSNRLSGNIFIQPTYKINSNLEFYGGLTYAQRPPTLEELYGFYLFDRLESYDYIGNPNLKNEASFNTHLGFAVRYEKVAFSIEGFFNTFSNYIIGTKLPDYDVMNFYAQGVKQFSNISSALLTGGELTVKYQPIHDLTFQSINSFVYGVDGERDFLPYIPPFRSVNSVSYHFKGFHFGFEHIGSLAQNNVNTEKYGETKTPAFNIFNFGVQKHFEFKNDLALHAEFMVENIFDTPYYEHLDIMKLQRQGVNFVVRVGFAF